MYWHVNPNKGYVVEGCGRTTGQCPWQDYESYEEALLPIIPVAIKGTSNIMEKYNSKKMVPGTVEVTILPEISPDIFNDRTLQEAADYIKNIITTEINKEG